MILEIKKYPDPILRKKCEPVEKIDEKTKEIAQTMIEIQKTHQGIGLAASQIGILKRIIVVEIDNNFCVFINPKISKKSKKKEIMEEGCLSFPGLFLKIKRPQEIEVEAIDLNGNKIKMKVKGLIARVFQHEIDHLNGILFIDRLPWWKRIALKKKLKIANN